MPVGRFRIVCECVAANLYCRFNCLNRLQLLFVQRKCVVCTAVIAGYLVSVSSSVIADVTNFPNSSSWMTEAAASSFRS